MIIPLAAPLPEKSPFPLLTFVLVELNAGSSYSVSGYSVNSSSLKSSIGGTAIEQSFFLLPNRIHHYIFLIKSLFQKSDFSMHLKRGIVKKVLVRLGTLVW